MFEQLFQDPTQRAIFFLVLAVLGMIAAYLVVARILRHYGRNPKYLLPDGTVKKVAAPILLILFALILRMQSLRSLMGLEEQGYAFRKTSTVLVIFAITWLIINALHVVKTFLIGRYDLDRTDNLKARKVVTQFTILERIFIFIVIVLAIGITLMSFESIRQVGLSVFASAGVAGIIIGLSAQKIIGTILAGIQIALTQPIRLDDVVVVEGEWGRIEEITLTYVVIHIWDKRRLVVPTTYFIENPFQNWTKSSSDLVGTVFLYTDYEVPFRALRDELDRILRQTDLWDGEAASIQVTDSRADYVELRVLVSARDAPTIWNLRVLVREKLIEFLQREYPESIARRRVIVSQNETQGPRR